MAARATANKVNDTGDKLQHYCSPCWAGRQLIHTMNSLGIHTANQAVFDPCAGQGHLIHGFRQTADHPEGYAAVYGDDIESYGGKHYVSTRTDYVVNTPTFRGHVCTNPPFHLMTEFALAARDGGASLIAMLVRAPAICGQGRHDEIYAAMPPRYVMPFTVRPHMRPGAPPERYGNSAMDSVWIVWVMPSHEAYDGVRKPEMVWLPTSRDPFMRDDDWFETWCPLPVPKKEKKAAK